MEARIQKWGNSNGIRIPSSILKSLGLKTNDSVIISENDDKIVITKAKDEKISLKDRFKKYDGPNLINDFEWDKPRGRKIW